MKNKIDKFTKHEALDRTSIMALNVEQLLLTNKFILNNKKLKKLAKKSANNLYKLYQERSVFYCRISRMYKVFAWAGKRQLAITIEL